MKHLTGQDKYDFWLKEYYSTI